jgi:EpsI family protein
MVVSVLLLGQSALFYGMPKERPMPLQRPLASFPITIEGWRMVADNPLEQEVLDVLKADDTVSRIYQDAAGTYGVSLFMAFFESQSTGVAPHSPKNCLPGSGWTPSTSDTFAVPMPDRQPLEVNRYIVAKGPAKSLVLYWYQTHNRVVANEYAAKMYQVFDSLRYRRSDTAIVRVVAPVGSQGEEAAQQHAVRFIQAAFPAISQLFTESHL